MKLGSRIRVGLAAAAVFAQLLLPVAHAGFAAETNAPSRGPAQVAAATADASAIAAHDPSLCPICLALCQARVGIARVLPGIALRLQGHARVLSVEPSVALPSVPDLDAAAPRAPPVSPLVFA
jgi:hypothetical protein